MPEFVHLHNHSHYSIQDALPTVSELVDAAVKDNQKAIALTDHGVMFGIIEFYTLAKSKNIKPIIGFEAYIANGSRHEKNITKGPNRKRNYYHIILLAKDNQGYKNLVKLTSYAHTEGFYYRPRIDKELLEKYKDGLIATSACLGGVVSAHLADGNFDLAMAEAQYYKDLFGDDFYLEIQNHGLNKDPIILRDVPIIGEKLGIKVIATNDIHYMKKEHAIAHNILLNIRDASATEDTDIYNLRYGTEEYYFKTQEEMSELFKDNQEALLNTIEIADKCNCEIDLKTLYMPEFPIPKESKATNLDEYLRELVYDGLYKKFGELSDTVKDRAEYELNTIINMKFPGYFLIVWDFIRAARELGVSVGPGRGSAAGSLVAYALGITNVDPLPYDLLFERFLNPERISMPDIDIDFADDRRDRVIDYVKRKYGENAVAQIVTFGKLSSRQVITDVGRVLSVDLKTVKNITSKIPVVRGKVKKVSEALEMADLQWLKESDDSKLKNLVEFSKVLENRNRNTGVHAAGVVIAPGEISDYVPLYQSAKTKAETSEYITQYSMAELEKAGLVKMDFLGLRTLSIIDNSLAMIKANYDLDIDIDKIDFLDKKTYDLMGEGNTLGVFQFESPGMQEYLRRLKPQNLEEITAMNALYRPGPMDNIPEFIDRKFERKPITYLHPIMEKALKTTYGIIVYQEQVMLLVQHIADFSLGQADILRRAMGKKKISEMDKMKPIFIEGAANKGISESLALEIFDLIYKFADYGFNKSHSLAYSYLAYQTAWLKANYPGEFLAANMTAELNDQAKIVSLIEEAGKFGIKVLPPNVNTSGPGFVAKGNNIFFGMAGIKNVGVPAVESIVEARKNGEFISFFDFISRVDTRLINKRTLEALIYAGAFDSLNCGHRAALTMSIEAGLEYAKAIHESENSSMDSLFGGEASAAPAEPKIPEVKEWPEKVRLENEKSVLSFYVSGHPINSSEIAIKSLSTPIKDSDLEFDDDETHELGYFRIGGILSDIKKRLDKNNEKICFATLEDFYRKIELKFWSKACQKFEDLIVPDAVVVCEGRLSVTSKQFGLTVDEMFTLDEAIKKYCFGYKLYIDLSNFDDSALDKLHQEIKPELDLDNRLYFFVRDGKTSYRRNFSSMNVSIPIDKETANRIAKYFGTQNVRFIESGPVQKQNNENGRRKWIKK